MIQVQRLPTAALLLLVLTACNAERTPAPADTVATPRADRALPVDSVPPRGVAPAANPARFDGYGDVRFGMSAEEARQAWGDQLAGAPAEGELCYYLNPVSNPVPSYFAFMVEDGKFVRYDVGNDKEIAPGGGKRGMSAEEIRRRYAGRVEESAHKYVAGGKYLRIRDTAGLGVLVFETDAAGKVTEWRVGVTPQVDYVEGCS